MRKISLMLLAGIALLASCKKLDDLSDRVDSLEGRTTEIEARLASLEARLNEHTMTLQSLVSKVSGLEGKVYVDKVTTTSDGYTILFSDGTTAVISNGKDGADGAPGTDGAPGADGADGKTPVIGVYLAEDGVYYWTINGEVVTGEDGNPIRVTGKTPEVYIGDNGNWYIDGEDTGVKAKGEDAQAPTVTIGQNGNWYINGEDTGLPSKGTDGKDGADGKTPVFKVEGGKWYVSYDGESGPWNEVSVSGESSDPSFSLTETDTTVTISYNGQDFTFSKSASAQPLTLKVTEYESKLAPTDTLAVKYTLSGGDETTHVAVESNGFKSTVDEAECIVYIIAPADLEDGYVIIKAVRNSDGAYSAQYISIARDYYGNFGDVIVSGDDRYINW